jgi:hypothetical protein
VDALPRIGLLRETGFGDVPLLIPKPLARFQAESLEFLGLPSRQLIVGDLLATLDEALAAAQASDH